MADYITAYNDQPVNLGTGQLRAESPGFASVAGFTASDPGDPETAVFRTYLLGANFDTAWLIASRYEWHYGVLHTPLMAYPPAPQVHVGVHAPYCMRVVAWTAETTGQWPLCPSFVTGDQNEILVAKRILPQSPQPMDNGTHIYRASGIYVYSLILPLADFASLVAGTVAPDQFLNGPAPPLQPVTFLSLLPPSQGSLNTLQGYPPPGGGTSTLVGGGSPFLGGQPGQIT